MGTWSEAMDCAAGKSIADSRSKFYALREMFERELRDDQAHGEPQPDLLLAHAGGCAHSRLWLSLARSAIEEKRYEMLNEVVGDIPAVPSKAIPQLPSSKMPKLWSSDELDMLLQFLVDITLDIKANGTSPLVVLIAGKLSTSVVEHLCQPHTVLMLIW
jgi:hypothetical protein